MNFMRSWDGRRAAPLDNVMSDFFVFLHPYILKTFNVMNLNVLYLWSNVYAYTVGTNV